MHRFLRFFITDIGDLFPYNGDTEARFARALPHPIIQHAPTYDPGAAQPSTPLAQVCDTRSTE